MIHLVPVALHLLQAAPSAVVPLLSEFKHEAVITILVTIFLAVVSWPWHKAKEEWSSLKERLGEVQTELTTQRNNCLTTLQQQGSVQIGLLTKSVDALNDIKLDNREMVGYLRGKL